MSRQPAAKLTLAILLSAAETAEQWQQKQDIPEATTARTDKGYALSEETQQTTIDSVTAAQRTREMTTQNCLKELHQSSTDWSNKHHLAARFQVRAIVR